jgi:hypothetical protein
MSQRRPRVKDADNLEWLRGLPCLSCGSNIESTAAHVRYSDSRAAKRNTGMAEKSSDVWAVPLCQRCHVSQHNTNERQWWLQKNIDPIQVAAFLFCAKGDQERGEIIIREARGATD